MGKRLTWAEIQELYDQEWVELVDFDWPLNKAKPSSGIVRVHAQTRKEFDRLVLIDPPPDSALIFVGAAEEPAYGIIPSLNLRRLVNASK